jgi:hypothetical protein
MSELFFYWVQPRQRAKGMTACRCQQHCIQNVETDVGCLCIGELDLSLVHKNVRYSRQFYYEL